MRPGNKDFSGLNLQDADFSGLALSGADFSGANLVDADFSGANLVDADLSDANLAGVDFSGADLTDANLSDSNIITGDFTSATLDRTNFTDARAFAADLSETDLRTAVFRNSDFRDADLRSSKFKDNELVGMNLYAANLAGADMNDCVIDTATLVDANLSGAKLRGTTFVDADVRGMDISNSQLSGSTDFKGFCWEPEKSSGWDILAKSYERIREQFKKNALNTSQTSLYYRQRRARTLEAYSDQNYLSFTLGVLSELLTGYGVRVLHTAVWSVLLISACTLWYQFVPISSWEGGELHYSVATFVTSAPHAPATLQNDLLNMITRAIVMLETYFGTVLIILIGYVLGNRDSM